MQLKLSSWLFRSIADDPIEKRPCRQPCTTCSLSCQSQPSSYTRGLRALLLESLVPENNEKATLFIGLAIWQVNFTWLSRLPRHRIPPWLESIFRPLVQQELVEVDLSALSSPLKLLRISTVATQRVGRHIGTAYGRMDAFLCTEGRPWIQPNVWNLDYLWGKMWCVSPHVDSTQCA